MIRNPILPGFNPDPSICRVGNDYYIATSTFEWYPGVQIHHSTDLVNWALIKRPLDRASQLDLRGNPDSGGIWAPCLSYADGLFWLVYTDVKRYSRNFKDTHNYIVTAPAIEGPWSDPSYVNSSGFDPSLFHDDDGRKWFMNMCFNYRNDPIGGGASPHSGFAGILMQQWDAQSKKLVGQAKNVFRGSALGLVEGAHIFKRRGWYYMTVAEGGTGYDHAVTMARARSILGPYELHPEVHLITSKDTPGAALQRAGHGQMVETPDGLVYHTHLCSRPLPQSRCSPLGRETAIQRCEWHDDDWLYLANGSYIPDELVASPDPEIRPNAVELHHHRFDSKRLPIEFQWLRTPYPDRLFSLSEKGLTLYGRESIGSWFEQSLVARRQEHFSCRVETEVDFNPSNQQQVAGLTHYYNQHKYHAIVVTWHERYGRVLNIFSCAADWPDGKLTFPLPEPIPLHIDGPLQLAADIDLETLQFQWRGRGGDWQKLGPVLNAGLISDESGRGPFGSFTGAFVGMFAFDLSGTARDAVFKSFSYMPGGSAS